MKKIGKAREPEGALSLTKGKRRKKRRIDPEIPPSVWRGEPDGSPEPPPPPPPPGMHAGGAINSTKKKRKSVGVANAGFGIEIK